MPSSYCPTHWRSWLTNAHKELPTNIIFAHILQRARPMFGADKSLAGRRAAASEGGGDGSPGSDATADTVAEFEATKKPAASKRRKSAIARKLGLASGGGGKRQKKGV